MFTAIQKVPLCPLPSQYPSPNQRCHSIKFYHHQLVLYVLDFHLNGIIQHTLFSAWLLSLMIMLARVIHVVGCNRNLPLFIAV